MENQFFVDSEFLSPEALKRKHELETNPASRKNHMEYMPGMEIIKSDIRETVMAHVEEYDYDKYTARDVRAALDHETCSVEDFKALLSPAAAPFLEEMAQKARIRQAFWQYRLSFHPPVYCQLLRELLCILRLQLL